MSRWAEPRAGPVCPRLLPRVPQTVGATQPSPAQPGWHTGQAAVPSPASLRTRVAAAQESWRGGKLLFLFLPRWFLWRRQRRFILPSKKSQVCVLCHASFFTLKPRQQSGAFQCRGMEHKGAFPRQSRTPGTVSCRPRGCRAQRQRGQGHTEGQHPALCRAGGSWHCPELSEARDALPPSPPCII